jgi:hypothetical protein
MKKYDDYNALTSLDESREISKLILEFNKTINDLYDLHNNKLISENDKSLLEVSLWGKAKFLLSKLGRYKAGGKILGKGKIDQEAGAKIQKILDKKGNELISGLNDEIKKINSTGEGEFPNNQDSNIFLDIILKISATYDSIVSATKIDPKTEGYLPPDMANAIIEDLREYVKKYLDVDLTAAYTVMDSEDESEETLITDSETTLEEDRESDVRSQLQAKSGEEKIDSIRMGKKGLASNKLPIILSAIGGSLGILSWIAQTEWFKDLVYQVVQNPDKIKTDVINKTITDNLNVDERGWSYTIQNNGFQDATGLDLGPKAPVENLQKAFEHYGGGDEQKGLDAMSQFLNPNERAESLANLKAQLADPNNETIGDIFNKGEGTWGTQGLFGQYGGAKQVIATQLIKTIKRTLIKGGVKTVVKSKVGAALIKAAPWLGPLGIALLGTGALVKIMREKGKRQSRAKTLNDLLQSLQFVEAPEILPDTPKPGDEDTGTKDTSGKNICNAKNLNELNKLLEETKSLSQPLKDISKYQKDPEFRKLFLEAFIGSTRQIKINQEPLLKTLKKLKENGLLEYGESSGGSMSGSRRKYVKLTYQDLQKFLNSLMKLFSAVYKSCKKTSQTYQVIKNFFKQLFKISSEGKGSFSDEKKREQLWKKLTGNFSNFLNDLNKLPKMEKGPVPKTEPKEPEEGRGGEKGTKGTFDGSAPRTKPPQLAHHDKGDDVISEEIKRIKKLMK